MCKMTNEEKESKFTTNPVLAVLELASKKGLKFDFDGDGTYETIDKIVSGKDGDAFATWAIYEKMSNGLTMKGMKDFINAGTKISFAKCKPGDLLVKHEANDAHVFIVINNNVSDEKFILADSNETGDEVRLSEHSYSRLSGTYVARDMSQVYGK